MIKRFPHDESGMAMALAVFTMVLIGVMGAGLLTFVVTDLNTVVEVNQGQRAFEMADAGVQAAKRQLASDSQEDSYDGTGADVQWSFAEANLSCPELGGFGMCLENLDGVAGTDDSVNVTIESLSADSFRVVSTGGYGEAMRRVEAFYGRDAGGSYSIPAYYTPGNILVEKGARIDGVSLFSGQSIILKDYDFGNYGLTGPGDHTKVGGEDYLGNWNSTEYEPPTTYNTQPRSVDTAGFAAEGYICRNALSDAVCQEQDQIADGRHGYDRTTDTAFVRKVPPDKDPNDLGTISYPFPTNPPDAEYLKGLAEDQSNDQTDSGNNYVNVGAGDELIWDELFPSSDDGRVVFVDLADRNSTFQLSNSSNARGLLVVRCGDLELQQKFDGVIIVLKGEGSGCDERARFTHNPSSDDSSDRRIVSYVYAEGTKDYGISISARSRLEQPNEGSAALENAGGSGSVKLQTWRELYE